MVMVNSVEGHMPLLLPFLYAEKESLNRDYTVFTYTLLI